MTDAAGSRRSPVVRAAAIAVAAVATAAYFYRPFSTPPGYFTDALSNVINAVFIHTFGVDEYGVAYPVVGFRSFNDFKPPLFMYVCSLLMYVVEPSVAVARLVGMVAGWLGIAVTVGTARRLIGPGVFAWAWAPIGALALLSSWVLVPQRIAMEMTLVVLAVAVLTAASLALLRDPASRAAGLAMGVAWGLLPYVYHSTRLMYFLQLPMILVALAWGRGLRKTLRAPGLHLALLVGLCLGGPLIADMLGARTALARFNVVGSGLSVEAFVQRFAQHLGPTFLFVTGDANPRHHSGFQGMLNRAFLPLLPMGLLMAARHIRHGSGAHLYILLSLVVALVPVSLTHEGLPHALRTLGVVPALVLLAFMGADGWWALAVRTGLKKTGAALAAVVMLCGAWLAAENVRAYVSQPLAPDTWVYFGPDPAWRDNDRVFAMSDHSPASAPYRYYRIVELKDYRFRDD